jgi:diacylglycerol kinase family enzyme
LLTHGWLLQKPNHDHHRHRGIRVKVAVILNPAAGSHRGREAPEEAARVSGAFGRAGIEAQVEASSRDAFTAMVQRAMASDADVVAVGGGDGTLSAAAAALVGGPKPLGVLPMGTLNHFAKDALIPLDLDQAVETIKAFNVIPVDVGEVNGRIFINNSSIGLYPTAVHEREELRHRSGGGKWPAMFNASLDLFRRFPLLDVTLRAEDQTVATTTPFVFVGNNRYEMNLLSLGRRATLQGGELSVYLPRDGGRMGLMRLALRALFGRLDQERDFHSAALRTLEIRTPRKVLRVSLDGEVAQMTSPIRYSMRPRALRLCVPAAAPQAAAA